MHNQISTDLAEFIGILVGDGGINKSTRNVVIHNGLEDYIYMEKYVKPLIKRVFNIDTNVIDRRRRNEILIRISSTSVFELLTEKYGLWSGPKYSIGIPEIMKSGSDKICFAFLRGLADSDFSFMFKKGGKYPIIRANFKSKNLVIDLKELFQRLGFSSFIETDKDRSYKTRTWVTNVITLSGRANMNRWFNLIGSSNPKHYTKFLLWKKNGVCEPYTTLSFRLQKIKEMGVTGFEFASYDDKFITSRDPQLRRLAR